MSFCIPAHAETTCHEDEQGNLRCCDLWVIDTYTRGKKDGAITKESYDKLMRALESSKHTHKALCNYWKGEDCYVTFGSPRCSGKNSTKQKPAVQLDLSAEERIQILNNARLLIGDWEERLRFAISAYSSAEFGSGSTPVFGRLLMQYQSNLMDAERKLKRVKGLLNMIHDTATGKIYRNLEEATKDFQQATHQVSNSYSALPQNAQNKLQQAIAKVRDEEGGKGAKKPDVQPAI